MTQQEMDSIIEEYINGTSLDSLIKKYHHTHKLIREILINNGIEIRTSGNKGKEKQMITPEIEQKIIVNYQRGMGLKASGAEFGVSYYKVSTILEKYGIHRRDKHEGIQVRNAAQRKYFCNENFFKTQTPDMAYILGFIAADGTVRKANNEIKITLAERDSELLEKIKYTLEYTGKVKHSITQDGYDIATLTITCAEYKTDLAKYNIVPNKTFTFSIPERLEKKYWIDFIRGYWDGDGTICTAGKNAIRSSLCSAQKNTLEQILNYLEEVYDIPRVTIQEKKNQNTIYYFQYSINSTKKLYKALYYNNNVLCLKRKKDKFDQLCVDNKIHETAHPT